MEHDAVKAVVEFRESADMFFSSLFRQFEQAAHSLDRKKDENVFQQLLGKYSYQFRHQLEEKALQLIDRHRSLRDIEELKKSLTGEITRFANDFIQRARSV